VYDYSTFPNDLIFFIDMKSFYASISCILMGLDPLTSKLAVVGDTKRDGSVVLASTPEMKKLGIKTGSRNFEILRQKDVHIVNPSMGLYVKISNEITKIILSKYVAPCDFMQYSIDEFAFSMKGYEKLHKKTPIELAHAIKEDIYDHFGLSCSIGIGPNLLMSKICMDVEAKKSPNGIAMWSFEDVEKKLWKINPLSKFWGIAKKTEQKLNRLGITTIGELACYPKEVLIKQFGNVMGTELHLHSNGIDFSKIGEKKNYKPKDKSIGKSQVLLRDYQSHEINTLILEQLEEVCYRLRCNDHQARTIHFGIGYSSGVGGFSKSVTIEEPTNLTKDFYKVCLNILEQCYNKEPIRTISIALKNFVNVESEQISFFTVPIKKQKDQKLSGAMDSIRRKYGKNSLLRACSFTAHSTIRANNNKIGGHLA